MSFRVNSVHWEIIIDFMEKHKDLAKGYISGPSGKDTLRKLWQELTIKLNSAGLGERPTKKWQKTWIDFKHILKKKAADLKSKIAATGGGPPTADNLSEIEKRVLGILGPSFYKGVGRPENGCSFLNPRKEHGSEIGEGRGRKVHLKKGKTSPEEKDGIQRNEEFPHKRLAEHDYIKQPMERGPKKVRPNSQLGLETIYYDTLNELRDIKTCMKELSMCATGIQSALNKIANTIIIKYSDRSDC